MQTKRIFLSLAIISLIFVSCGLWTMLIPTPTPAATNTPDVEPAPIPTETPVPLNPYKVYIEGIITWMDPQKPVANAALRLVYGDSSSPAGVTTTDAAGHFAFKDLPPIKDGFGFEITIPSGELVCYRPVLVNKEWLKTVSAFYPNQDEARIWLQNNKVAVPKGKVIAMDIVLKCP